MSIWPVEGNGPNQFSLFKAKMAMAILGKNKHYHFKDIQRRHFNRMAATCFNRADAEGVIARVLERTPTAIQNLQGRLPVGFPEWIAMAIFNGLSSSAARLESMAKY